MSEYHSYSPEETQAKGAEFGQTLKPGTLVTFQGDLGAGKTTFIQGLLAVCGADRPYVSPTFVLMKEYNLETPTSTGIRRIYHADAYRIERPEEFQTIGFLEWLEDPEGVVILEWPERIRNLLASRRTEIVIGLEGESDRRIEIKEFV